MTLWRQCPHRDRTYAACRIAVSVRASTQGTTKAPRLSLGTFGGLHEFRESLHLVP